MSSKYSSGCYITGCTYKKPCKWCNFVNRQVSCKGPTVAHPGPKPSRDKIEKERKAQEEANKKDREHKLKNGYMMHNGVLKKNSDWTDYMLNK